MKQNEDANSSDLSPLNTVLKIVPAPKVYPVTLFDYNPGCFLPSLNMNIINAHVCREIAYLLTYELGYNIGKSELIRAATIGIINFTEQVHSILEATPMGTLILGIEDEQVYWFKKALKSRDLKELREIKNKMINYEISSTKLCYQWRMLNELFAHISVSYLVKGAYGKDGETSYFIEIADIFTETTLEELRDYFSQQILEHVKSGICWAFDNFGFEGALALARLSSVPQNWSGGYSLELFDDDMYNRFNIILDALKAMNDNNIPLSKLETVLEDVIELEEIPNEHVGKSIIIPRYVKETKKVGSAESNTLTLKPYDRFYRNIGNNGNFKFPVASVELQVLPTNKLEVGLPTDEELNASERKTWMEFIEYALMRYQLLNGNSFCPFKPNENAACRLRIPVDQRLRVPTLPCRSCAMDDVVRKVQQLAPIFSSLDIDNDLVYEINKDPELKSLRKLITV